MEKKDVDSLYAVLKVQTFIIFLDSSVVERSAVNRNVVGSSPTRGVKRPVIRRLQVFFNAIYLQTGFIRFLVCLFISLINYFT